MDAIVSAPGRIQFQFPLADWAGIYDAFEVSRSRSGDGGPYEPLMAGGAWLPAFFTLQVHNAYDVVGKQLELLVDDRILVVVTFTGTTPASVMADLAAAMPGFLLCSNYVISTANVGLTASLEVMGGDAAPKLGLVAGTIHYGMDKWRALVAGQESYDFYDPFGLETDFYRVRLTNQFEPAGGRVYPPVPGQLRGGLPAGQLIEGYVQMIDLTGRPCENVLVTLYASERAYPPVGLMPATVEVKTDKMGWARVKLVRGSRMTLSISGTNLAREILVPTEGDSFSLLDPSISVDPDAYKVQVPNIVVGERRSL